MTQPATPQPSTDTNRFASPATALGNITAESAMADRQVRQRLAQLVIDGFAATGALDIPTGLRDSCEATARVLLRDESEREAHAKFVTPRRNGAGIDPGLDRAERGLGHIAATVVDEGPSGLTGEQLAALLVCPATLGGIGNTLNELAARGGLPARWRPPTEVAAVSLPGREESAPASTTLTPAQMDTIRDAVALAVESGTAIPVLPAEFRERLVTTLTHVLVDRPDREQYLTELNRQLTLAGTAVPDLSGIDIPVEDLSGHGFSRLSDEQVMALAIQPHVIRLVAEWIDERADRGELAEEWWTAIERSGEAAFPEVPMAEFARRVAARLPK